MPHSCPRPNPQANTNVLYWGGRLLALWEGGLPHLIDPITLQTFGESKLANVLKYGQNLGAHPRYDPATNRYVFFSTDPDPRKTKVTLFEFDDKFKLAQERTVEFPGFSLCHDFVITKDYYIFFKAPLSISPLPWLFGLTGVASCIRFDESQPTMVYMIPRDAAKPMVELPVDAHFSFHFVRTCGLPFGAWCDVPGLCIVSPSSHLAPLLSLNTSAVQRL